MEELKVNCPNCTNSVGVSEEQVYYVRRRWAVDEMRVLVGKPIDPVRDSYSPHIIHKAVEVLGVSVPEQENEILNRDAQDYSNEYLEDGIKVCKLKDWN